VRYDFSLGGRKVDIVAFNNRQTDAVNVYAVDPQTRLLTRVDDDHIATTHAMPNYGFGLYHSWRTDKLYAVVTQAGGGNVEQIELFDDGAGKVRGVQVRKWQVGGLAEGVVADDEAGQLYICEEAAGVWQLDAEPTGPAPGALVAGMRVGDNGFEADAEGVTVFAQTGGRGFIIVSSQGISRFFVWQRQPPHAFVGSFSIAGTEDTDGIDATAVPLGPEFPEGGFVAHNGSDRPYTNQLVSWQAIRTALPALTADPTADPRRAPRQAPPPPPTTADAARPDAPDAGPKAPAATTTPPAANGCSCRASSRSDGQNPLMIMATFALLGACLHRTRRRLSHLAPRSGEKSARPRAG
jgi:3-phytase